MASFTLSVKFQIRVGDPQPCALLLPPKHHLIAFSQGGESPSLPILWHRTLSPANSGGGFAFSLRIGGGMRTSIARWVLLFFLSSWLSLQLHGEPVGLEFEYASKKFMKANVAEIPKEAYARPLEMV